MFNVWELGFVRSLNYIIILYLFGVFPLKKIIELTPQNDFPYKFESQPCTLCAFFPFSEENLKHVL